MTVEYVLGFIGFIAIVYGIYKWKIEPALARKKGGRLPKDRPNQEQK